MGETSGDIRGLCVNCDHLILCLNKLIQGMVIESCADFSDSMVRAGTGRRIEETGKNAANATELMGLCVSCGIRTRCPKALRPGGVWHCEDYI